MCNIYSDRDGYYEETTATTTAGISSVSNRRHGTNSDALTVTPQSHNHICSPRIAISYPISMQRDNTPDTVNTVTPHINNTNSLQFLASPPLSAITGVYSQLSTRAVTYSPAAQHRESYNTQQQHRDDSHSYGNYLHVYNRQTTPYIESETQLPKLPSPIIYSN